MSRKRWESREVTYRRADATRSVSARERSKSLRRARKSKRIARGA